MKPPENVTLIDFEGKPIKHKYDNLSGIPCRCESESVFGQVIAYEVLIGNCVVFSGKAEDRELARKLVDFLNDQLTFIRNGMWETLAIYQATLGRFVSREWFITEIDNPVPIFDNRKRGDFMGYHITDTHKMFLPYSVEFFIKHYTDVFSKLTPWEGAT